MLLMKLRATHLPGGERSIAPPPGSPHPAKGVTHFLTPRHKRCSFSRLKTAGSDWEALSDKLAAWGPLGRPALHTHQLPTQAGHGMMVSEVTGAADRGGEQTKAGTSWILKVVGRSPVRQLVKAHHQACQVSGSVKVREPEPQESAGKRSVA
ncbi:hypothetical protein E2C01_004559 [Portunus trituberculatus]|uniref:Uncharacterized protein n=1 Tax=Portunus trituberculatus TaxID=210409 RepID=A0A5B7CTB0_PORTR|nr:hypothetical protein [Portunus trituberculatus]